jgi:hypothetical protein
MYSPTDCLETFPFSAIENRLEIAGAADDFFRVREEEHRRLQVGLTDLYNKIHLNSCHDSGIESIRVRQRTLDEAVLQGLGLAADDFPVSWTTVRDMGFWGLEEAARSQLIDRVLALNHELRAQKT